MRLPAHRTPKNLHLLQTVVLHFDSIMRILKITYHNDKAYGTVMSPTLDLLCKEDVSVGRSKLSLTSTSDLTGGELIQF